MNSFTLVNRNSTINIFPDFFIIYLVTYPTLYASVNPPVFWMQFKINCRHQYISHINLQQIYHFYFKMFKVGSFSGGVAVECLPANAGDTGSISSPRRSHMPKK